MTENRIFQQNLFGIEEQYDNRKDPKQQKAVSEHVPVVKKPVPNDSVEDWYHFFAEQYRKIDQTQAHLRRYYGEDFYLYISFRKTYIEFRNRMFTYCESWPPTLQQFFKFHAILFIMSTMENINLERHGLTDRPYFEEAQNDLLENLPGPLRAGEKKNHLHLWQKVLQVVHTYYFQELGTIFNWLLIYRILWSHQLYDTPLLAKELALLTPKATPQSPNYHRAILGLAHFQIITGKGHKAKQLLAKLQDLALKDVFDYFYSCRESGDWQELLLWLRWASPRATRASGFEFKSLCELWGDVAQESGVKEEYVQILKSWLPRSFGDYAQALLSQDQYQEWADLHICYDHYFMSIPTGELRLVETKAPRVLLPLYHQWVVRLIEHKNRKAYKDAVKLLKKLRTLYKRLKQTERWEGFLQLLMTRYARLRALQEEMTKGKLVS